MKLTIEGTLEEIEKVLQAITSSEEQTERCSNLSGKLPSVETIYPFTMNDIASEVIEQINKKSSHQSSQDLNL